MLLNGKSNANSIIGKTPKMAQGTTEPDSMEKFNWLIHLQHVRGEISTCKKLICEAIQRSQNRNEFAYFKQGIIEKQDGHLSGALETFQKCLKLNPQSGLILKQVAKCLFEMHRYRLALNAYLEIEQFDNSASDWQLAYLIAQTYAKLGNVEKAKEYAHKSVKLGKQEESYLLLIKNLQSERDYRSAVAVANAGVESCQDSVKLLTESGLLYLKVGQSQHAFERLSQAVALDPANARALLGIGCITHRHEEFDVALSKYKIAVLYDPESIALWNNIGICFYSKEKYIAAISCLKRGLWLAPLNWKVLYNLGLVHLSTGQPASAFNFACAAVNLRPDLGECFALLAHALYLLNDTENAIRAIKQANSLSPKDVNVIMNLAVLLHLTGEIEEASKTVERFKALMDEGQTVSNEVLALVDKLAADEV